LAILADWPERCTCHWPFIKDLAATVNGGARLSRRRSGVTVGHPENPHNPVTPLRVIAGSGGIRG
jgi:hypothetical protein